MGSQVSPTTYRIMVLVKGDRQMGSQVSPTTHRILVLVKGDHQKGSQVNSTVTPILALAKGNCQMGFQVGQATKIDFLDKRDRQKGSRTELHVNQTGVRTQMIARFGILRQLSFYHSFWAKKDCCKDKVSDQSSLGKISLGSSVLFIFIKLTTQKPCSVSIIKRGHLL